MKGPILRNFVSEMDKFLNEFDKEHPKLTKSQQKEVTKYKRIYRLRDDKNAVPATSEKLWKDF